MNRPLVYVAGPLTNGDVEKNVRNAIDAANFLLDLGFSPFVPHLTYYMHAIQKRDYEFWMTYCLSMVPHCHAVLRIPGESPGAERELQAAAQLDIPTFSDVNLLVDYFREVM